jgi:hypothetical protein
MDRECYHIVFFGQGSLKTRHLKIHKKTFYLVTFCLFLFMLFFCDYIQVKKQAFNLNRLRQESTLQKSQIQFFSIRIEELEGQLSKLMEFDRRIRMIANLERTQEIVPFIGMGGDPSVGRHDK